MALRFGRFRFSSLPARISHQKNVVGNKAIESRRQIHFIVTKLGKKFNQPTSGYDMPRSGGIATAFRLPLQENKPEGLDACFVGIPMDNGVSGRTGTRLAPRSIRNESTMIRAVAKYEWCCSVRIAPSC